MRIRRRLIQFEYCNAGERATGISATQGTPQKDGLGIAFAPLQATVLDAVNIPVNGALVTFTIVPNGAISGSFAGNALTATATTDVNGRAVYPTLTANQTLGSFTVNATTAAVNSTASFNLTNITMKFGDLSGDGQIDITDLVLLANVLAGNVNPSPTQKPAGDVFDDHTGQVTIQDLVTLANFLAGNIHSLPVIQGQCRSPVKEIHIPTIFWHA